MRYVLQDAADQLGFEDMNVEVMNEAWRMSLISQEHLLKMRSVKGIAGTRFVPGAQPQAYADPGLMAVCAADPRPQGLRDAAIIGILYGSGMRKSESMCAMTTNGVGPWTGSIFDGWGSGFAQYVGMADGRDVNRAAGGWRIQARTAHH